MQKAASPQFLSRAATVIFENASFLVGQTLLPMIVNLLEQPISLGVEVFVVMLRIMDLQQRLRPGPALRRAHESPETVGAGQASKVPAKVPVTQGERRAHEMHVIGDAARQRRAGR